MARRAKKNSWAVAGGVLGGVALTGIVATAAVVGGGYWFLIRPMFKVNAAARDYLLAQGYELPAGVSVKQSLKKDGWHVTGMAIAPGDTQPREVKLLVDKKTFEVRPLYSAATALPNWGWQVR
jgi:hypothetical protein